MHHAHTQQLIHRDIKPENILLAQDGRLQVADVGIAVMAQTTHAAQEIVGSWTYMAPEQFEGCAEPASDQYALGMGCRCGWHRSELAEHLLWIDDARVQDFLSHWY